MLNLPLPTIRVVTALQKAHIEPILYGSQGVSLYLGAFRQFGDIDLLVESRWIHEDWQKLVTVMRALGFTVRDEHEHDFADITDVHVGFADSDILVRDNITRSVDEALELFNSNGLSIRTLKPQFFKNAYEFSERDGYRKDVRGKKDREVITLLNDYLNQHPRPIS